MFHNNANQTSKRQCMSWYSSIEWSLRLLERGKKGEGIREGEGERDYFNLSLSHTRKPKARSQKSHKLVEVQNRNIWTWAWPKANSNNLQDYYILNAMSSAIHQFNTFRDDFFTKLHPIKKKCYKGVFSSLVFLTPITSNVWTHARSVKHRLIMKLIAQIEINLRDKSIKPN
jgi:hypothetical protein